MTACHPATLYHHTMLLEGIKISWQLATPTLQQGAELSECQYSSTDKKIMYLQYMYTHTQHCCHSHRHRMNSQTCLEIGRLFSLERETAPAGGSLAARSSSLPCTGHIMSR